MTKQESALLDKSKNEHRNSKALRMLAGISSLALIASFTVLGTELGGQADRYIPAGLDMTPQAHKDQHDSTVINLGGGEVGGGIVGFVLGDYALYALTEKGRVAMLGELKENWPGQDKTTLA